MPGLYYDGFNRLVQERKASQTAGTFSATDRIYNSVGLLASQSLPYFSSGSSYTSPTSIGLLYTSYTYDTLKRALKTSNAVGTTTNVYAKWTTTTTDPNGNIKDYTLDAYGNLASVVEHIGGSLATTTYAYDAVNNLATTTDSAGNVRGFAYDGLGRRLSAQDLHAPGHTPFGIWYYGYDDAGNQTSQTDPKGQNVTRTYDALNRLLTENVGSTTQITNTYDSCTNGIGYLCTASSTSAKTQNAYDILGRISFATTTVAGTGYTLGYSYDRQGDLSTLTYPNGSLVSYAYNLAGQPYRVQNKLSGGSWADIASSLAYAPQGAVTSALFGNGASSTWAFNANALYRLAALQTQGQGGTTIQNFSYAYDPVGNLTQIANIASTTNSASVSYAYDALNRLIYASTTAATTTPYLQSFSYDSLGNILTETNGATSSPIASLITIATTSLERDPGGPSTSDSFSFDSGSSGSNRVLIVTWISPRGGNPTSASYNGQSLTRRTLGTSPYYATWGYLVNPPAGAHTFTINYPNQSQPTYRLFVFQNVNQATPYDVDGNYGGNGVSSCSKTLTTTAATDTLFGFMDSGQPAYPSTEGSNQTEQWQTNPYSSYDFIGATKSAPTTGSNSMSFSLNASTNCEMVALALEGATSTPPQTATTSVYAYAQSGYANPDALTSLGNGLSTTTYSYDANGNLVQAGGWSYVWDYLNHMLAASFGNSTTTYAYDAFGSRVLQIGTTSTTTYPNKYYSITSTKVGGNTYATSTSYIWNGDTLLATIDQSLYNGTATGSPVTSFIHPDHLGSTNVVTNASGTVTQLLDYYPYGSTRVSSNTYPTNERRQYIGQFSDVQTNLDYLNARYYDGQRGQFLSEDPLFWTSQQNLGDPQSLNSYAYAEDNPITKKDPSGEAVSLSGLISALQAFVQALQGFVNSLSSTSGTSGGGSTTHGGGGGGSSSGSSSSGTGGGGGGGSYSYTEVSLPGGIRQQTTPTNCFKTTCDMLGYTPDPKDMIVTASFNSDGKLTTQAGRKGVQVIDSYLASGKRIQVGLNINGGTEDNINKATQHYVVINGTSTDSAGKYYHFVDPYGTHGDNP